MGFGAFWGERARALGRHEDYLYSEYRAGTLHDGTEGELYDLADDPLQRVNRFEDPAFAHVRAMLAERLWEHDVTPGRSRDAWSTGRSRVGER